MRQLKITKSITSRETASLDRFLADIAKEPMISAEDEVELARRIKNGDEKALEKLTKANLRFVVSVAKQYQNQGISLQDLINEGNIGLIKAAQRFDETRGFKFISYAVWWIRQSIMSAIAGQSRIVRLPLNQVGTLNKLKKELARFEQSLQRPPTLEELAAAVDMPTYKIAEILRMNTHTQSIDSPIDPDEETKFIDTFVDKNATNTDDNLMQESLSSEVNDLLSALPEKEQNVIRMFYGIDAPHELTLDEIGDRLDLSRERVRQVKERALKHLRQEGEKQKLRMEI